MVVHVKKKGAEEKGLSQAIELATSPSLTCHCTL